MSLVKKICALILILAILCYMAGCRNNLKNDWDEYSGNTEIYTDLQSSAVLSFEEAQRALQKDDADFSIPDYWKNEVKSSITKTNNCISRATGEYTSFLWYTDAHWSYGSQLSVPILMVMEKCTLIDHTNFGGDIVSTYNVDADENKVMLEQWRKNSLKISNHHSVAGNHDDDVDWLSKRKDLYNFLIAPELENDDTDDSFSYFVDDNKQKTRYIYLSTGFEETSKKDLEILVDALISTKADWHIVVISHIWFVYDNTDTPTVGTVPEYVASIFSILDSYNARTSGVHEGVKFDFSNADAKVEFCIGGHTHVDFDFSTQGSIPVILTETDSYHLRGDNKSNSETNEASVSAIIADYEKSEVNIIRVGRGEDRVVKLVLDD